MHNGSTTNRRIDGALSLLGHLELEPAINMAGPAAERLIFGEVSAGAGSGSDLARATSLALSIKTQLGLGAYGPIQVDLPPEIVLRDPEARAHLLDRIKSIEARAHAILAAHRHHLAKMAVALLQNRELASENLDMRLTPA